MPQFTDSRSRVWQVPVTVGSIKRVKSRTGLNLCDALDGALMTELGQDPLRFAEVLFHLLAPQAEAAKVSEEDLADALAGDVLGAAYEAFCTGLIDFFQRPEQRELLGKLKTKTEAAIQAAGRRAVAFVESATTRTKIDQQIERIFSEAEASMSGNSSGDSPAPPG